MLQHTSEFLTSNPNRSEAKVVLFGIPMDYTVCFRPGTRFGPASLRQASYGLEHYSLQFDDSLKNRSFHDAGDLVLPFGNATQSLREVESFVRNLTGEQKAPFAFGGEHLVTLPIVRALYDVYPNLHVIQFDAHADLADTYFDEPVTHATVMRRILDFLPHDQFFQFGIRSADKLEVEFARNISHHPFEVSKPLAEVLKTVAKDAPIYVTLDVDVFDPAYAPGTGTPEAGGITPREMFEAFGLLRGRNIVGADLVEIAPALDPTGCTAVLGAKLVREMLLTLFEWANLGGEQPIHVTALASVRA